MPALGVVLVAVVALGAYVIWITSRPDPVQALERQVIDALDDAYGRAESPSWCAEGCSATGHEWHVEGSADVAAEQVVALMSVAGLEATLDSGAPEAFLVRIVGVGSSIDLGVTGSEWIRASSDATGTAVWFTSVTVFDQPPP